MSPTPTLYRRLEKPSADESLRPTSANGLVLEAWAEGYMIGSLIIMTCITIANMRRGVLLHKLILIELIFGYWQGFFVLFNPPIYAWWLSVAAIFLNASWWLHNVIAWMKLRPFLNKTVSRIFIGTVILTIPYWITEIYANFAFFHNENDLFLKTRPFEALCRDPWWIAAAVFLMYNIKTKYDLSLLQIVRISPRFAVMLGAMMLSIIFIILDVCSVTGAFKSTLPVGINPFWKLSFVFKCLTDSVVLDDFKTALDRLRAFKISRLGSFAGDVNDMRSKEHHETVFSANNWAEPNSSREGLSDLAPVHEPNRPDHLRKINPGTSHVEDTRPAVIRMLSKDKDSDEAGVKIVDHAREHAGKSIPERDDQPTDPLNMWTRKSSATSSDPDLEYAMACRQVAINDRRSGQEHVSIAK